MRWGESEVGGWGGVVVGEGVEGRGGQRKRGEGRARGWGEGRGEGKKQKGLD